MRPRLGHDDRGIALVTSIVLMMVMLGLGLAMLSVVDTQGKAAGEQRDGDAAFNLADAALSSTAFVLSHNWPEAAAAAQPWSQAPDCGHELIAGGVADSEDSTMPGQIQRLVHQASAARGGPPGASWSVRVCDAGNEPTWSSVLLTRPPFDATGRRVLTDPNGNRFMVRRLWVRAQATVNGATRAAASLVQVSEIPAFPAGYGILAGRMAFLNGLNVTTDSILGDKTALGSLTNALLGTRPMVTGQIGVRCGLLSELCLDSVAATLTGIPLLTSTGLANGEVTQYGSATAVPQDTVRLLRERAARAGTYVPHIAAGSTCLPSGVSPNAGGVVFVESVGTGKDTCTLAAGPAGPMGTVIVGSGRISVTAPNPHAVTTFTGVIYALNTQADRQAAVVTLNQGVQVKGGVFVDGGGTVAIYPPSFSLTQTLCNSILGPVLCLLTPVTGLLDAILGVLGVNRLLTMLLPQLSTYGPIVQYDADTVAGQTVFGSSGAVQGTFRQVPAGR